MLSSSIGQKIEINKISNLKTFQELALYGEFSILETLQYFGRIYGMDSSDVQLRAKFIIGLLDLPSDASRLVRNLRYC